MSYVFDYNTPITFEQKVAALEQDIKRYTKACRSDWPRPIDFTNLMDAQYQLKALKARCDDLALGPC